jgi:hypothetical protein
MVDPYSPLARKQGFPKLRQEERRLQRISAELETSDSVEDAKAEADTQSDNLKPEAEVNVIINKSDNNSTMRLVSIEFSKWV